MTGSPTRRDWMKVGQVYHNNRMPELEREIAGLDWHELREGETLSLPMMPGEGIKQVIRELRLPKVDAVAWNGYWEFPDGPGFPHALDSKGYGAVYGIQAHYKDCDARIYLLDRGDGLTPLCVDVWEKAPVPA